jgi:hypothetical protein
MADGATRDGSGRPDGYRCFAFKQVFFAERQRRIFCSLLPLS